jgi:hypothetical protein
MANKKSGFQKLLHAKGKILRKREELKKSFFPTAYLNNEIELLDKNLEQYMQLQRHFCEYYQHQRNQRKELIKEAIQTNWVKELEHQEMWRVVGHKFSQDPLCTLGSIVVPPGGRFNFGAGLEGYEKYHCLYLGDSAQTCLYEKYHQNEEYEGKSIEKEFLALKIDETHTNYKIDVILENVIDIREEKFLKNFLECISDIPEPVDLNKTAKFYGWRQAKPIRKIEELRFSLLESNYTRTGITFGLPSNSQWLGYLCYQTGVQGIIYPSVRNADGYNLAVFIDNIKNSKISFVKLHDEIKYITPERRLMSKANVDTFKANEKL